VPYAALKQKNVHLFMAYFRRTAGLNRPTSHCAFSQVFFVAAKHVTRTDGINKI